MRLGALRRWAAGKLGPVMDAGPVVVNVYGIEEGDDLTGPEARALGAAPLNATDEWNRITGASS